MNKDTLIKNILQECYDEEFFLIKLRVERTFETKKFWEFARLLNAYADLIEDDENVNRRVARCVFELVTVGEGVLNLFREAKHPQTDDLRKAQSESTKILERLLI